MDKDPHLLDMDHLKAMGTRQILSHYGNFKQPNQELLHRRTFYSTHLDAYQEVG
jgi:hypothetical protein